MLNIQNWKNLYIEYTKFYTLFENLYTVFDTVYLECTKFVYIIWKN